MFDLNELEYLVAFADLGTFAKVSDKFHISTPTITRNMQHLEDDFGVSLFERKKNKIELNETGKMAVTHARNILKMSDMALQDVREFDKRQHSITIETCAFGPLLPLLPAVSQAFIMKTVSSSLQTTDDIVRHLENGLCEIGILPYPVESPYFKCEPYCDESLAVYVNKEHELAKFDTISFDDFNGYNFLFRTGIGYWEDVASEHLTKSRLIVQSSDINFFELIKTSSIPCFISKLASEYQILPQGRKEIPITDDCAKVTFYIASPNIEKYRFLIQKK